MENDGVGENTLNHEHAYLSAVFNELNRQGDMKSGDVLMLQKILGHSDIKLTMRYSLLSPQFMQKVVEINPISESSV